MPGNALGVFYRGEQIHDRYDRLDWTAYTANYDKVRLPDERSATVLVFQVYDRMSYALVVESSQVIRRGDFVANPIYGHRDVGGQGLHALRPDRVRSRRTQPDSAEACRARRPVGFLLMDDPIPWLTLAHAPGLDAAMLAGYLSIAPRRPRHCSTNPPRHSRRSALRNATIQRAAATRCRAVVRRHGVAR